MLKLPRTIRLDPSDEFVFPEAAPSGEWAVTGTFRFWDRDPAAFTGKMRQAFRAGFLGTKSFGWSTLVVVSEASSAEREAAIADLAENLRRHLGAPDEASARTAAIEEVDFAASLCEHPVNTILALARSAEGERIREYFRTLKPRDDIMQPSRAFLIVEDDGEDEPQEHVDLGALIEKDPR